MANNHILISRITTSQDVESVDITNISQQYTDLKIVVSMRSTDSAWYDYPQMYLNNDWDDGLGNYSYKRLYGSNNIVYSSSGTSMASPAIGSVGNGVTQNTFGNIEYYIFKYSSTTQYKNISCDAVGANNSSQVVMGINSSTRQSNQAISRIVFVAGLGYIKAGSSFSLYGIANAVTTPTSSPKAFGGDIIKTDGTYWYHAFLSSGMFTAQTNLNADVLVVGGGGGGSNSGGIGSGGGGGAIRYASTTISSGSPKAIVVGAGGARDNTSVGDGESGTPSSFPAMVASVVNKAIGSNNSSGRVGGDGGNSKIVYFLASDYYGGLGAASSYPRRGGSGAGAGNNGSSSYPAVGGNGSNTWSSWATATGTSSSGYYAGGGAGGYEYNGSMSRTAGGLGGGGMGGAGTNNPNYNATDGTVNTGGGGGGCGGQSGVIGGLSGNGGSGIVIIRYLV